MAEPWAPGTPYQVRVARWFYAATSVLAALACVYFVGSLAMYRYAWWELVWWGIVSLVFLGTAVANGRHWVRYPRRPATVYADRNLLRLAVGPDAVVELPWESVRKVGVAARPLGVSVWAEPADIEQAFSQLDQPTRIAVEGFSRRFQGRLRVPVWPTTVPARDVAAELAARAGDRCPAHVASITEDLGKPG